MSIGLIALLDDIAGLAKVAAASLDDVTAQAARAGIKAAGVVIDDAAVTPRYVVGFNASREIPIVAKIAAGSLKNKLLYLLPAALILGYAAPWAITPLLMIGGAYLCYEGSEKVFEVLRPHAAHAHEADVGTAEAPAGASRTRRCAAPSARISSCRRRSWPSPWRHCRPVRSGPRPPCSRWSAPASRPWSTARSPSS